MLFWAIRASIPTKNYENKTVCVFFQGASDGNAKIRRNINQKFKNNEKLDFQKIDLFNQVFRNSSTFGSYFDVFWYYHQTSLEKTRILSYFHDIRLE